MQRTTNRTRGVLTGADEVMHSSTPWYTTELRRGWIKGMGAKGGCSPGPRHVSLSLFFFFFYKLNLRLFASISLAVLARNRNFRNTAYVFNQSIKLQLLNQYGLPESVIYYSVTMSLLHAIGYSAVWTKKKIKSCLFISYIDCYTNTHLWDP